MVARVRTQGCLIGPRGQIRESLSLSGSLSKLKYGILVRVFISESYLLERG